MKKTNIYTIAIITFLIILLAVGGWIFYRKNHADDVATYMNPAYGISFQYPERYTLTETPMEGGTVVTILEKNIEIPRNGEGPTAITVSMYRDAPAAKGGPSGSEIWITTSSSSNFNLSSMTTPGATQVGNQDGYLYTWDGLYQGTTVVTEHEGNIIAFAVTYDGETDMEKREAFTDLIASVEFMEPGSSASSTKAE